MDEKYLREGIAYLTAVIERIGETAKAETRSRTEDEVAAVEAGVAWCRDADSQLKQLAEIRAMAAKVGAEPGEFRAEPVNVNRNVDPFDVRDLSAFTPPAELRGRARTAIERMVEVPASVRESLTDVMRSAHDPSGEIPLRVLLTSTPAYRSAFQKRQSGLDWDLEPAEREALRRSMSLTGANGGLAVPTPLDPTLIFTSSSTNNPMRRLARVVQTTVDEWNGVTTTGGSARWAAEASEAQNNSPTLGSPNIPVHKMDIFIPFSIEIGMDWANMESELRAVMVDARDDLEAAAHISGSGVGQPQGLITGLSGTASVVTPATAEVFARADVYRVASALPPRYRRSAQQSTWGADLATLNAIRQLFQGDNAWTDPASGMPATLLGYSVEEFSEMVASTDINASVTDTTNEILVLGDFSRYYIVDRVGLNVELVPHLFGTPNNRPTGQRGFYGFLRTGARCVDINAFRLLNIATTA